MNCVHCIKLVQLRKINFMKLKTKRLLIATILMIIAPLALYSTVNKYLQRTGVGNWPHIKGIVLFSGVEQQKRYNKMKTSTFNSRYSMRYVQRINYSYVVNGSDYTGKNFDINGSKNGSRAFFDGAGRVFTDKEKAREAALKYKKGTAVDVYYNPNNPEIASLSQSNASFLPILFAVGFLGFAVLTLLIALEKVQPEKLPWRKST